jgi:hypothetical protein
MDGPPAHPSATPTTPFRHGLPNESFMMIPTETLNSASIARLILAQEPSGSRGF